MLALAGALIILSGATKRSLEHANIPELSPRLHCHFQVVTALPHMKPFSSCSIHLHPVGPGVKEGNSKQCPEE